jgi:hypothetical protein
MKRDKLNAWRIHEILTVLAYRLCVVCEQGKDGTGAKMELTT